MFFQQIHKDCRREWQPDMVIKSLVFILFLFSFFSLRTQTDTTALPEVTVGIYLDQRKSLLRLPSSVSRVDSLAMGLQHNQSLVPVLNTVPGVRMEERSPGSYRLSVRGSLIRSPFGVRNIKVYLDEIPLTNAGGETYLNILDMNAIHSAEVIKGPDGSLFGANSGGVLRLLTRAAAADSSNYVKAGVGGGSFGLIQENVQIRKKTGRHVFGIDQAWQRSDGYREHSAMERKYFQLGDRFTYGPANELSVLLLYADHAYKTPGGLTKEQFDADPRQSRPGTRFVPGAQEQNASIRNRTFLGGITNKLQLGPQLRHVISLFGSNTFFENPFITNYEEREELNTGARSWLEYSAKNDKLLELTAQFGGEYHEINSNIQNFRNDQGNKTQLMAEDDLRVQNAFVFSRLVFSYRDRMDLEIAGSLNHNYFSCKRLAPLEIPFTGRTLQPVLMPRFAFNYLFGRAAFRLIASRGYSPPTLQEIRSSNNEINESLRPEAGWNYETGFRLKTNDQKIWWDVSAFYFRLSNMIVRRVSDDGLEYFENAGATDQKGLESQVNYKILNKERGLIRKIDLSNALTVSDFKFSGGSYSGNHLTGIPRGLVVSSLRAEFMQGLYLFTQHTSASSVPLNDLNSQTAKGYNLLLSKLGWRKQLARVTIDISAGVDNLLNERYSLGHDLNAFGERYYNSAPSRNYFARLVVVM